MQPQEEKKEDVFDMTLTQPDNDIDDNTHHTPMGPSPNPHDITENKELEHINNNDIPQRQSMSPPSKPKSKNPFADDQNSIINNCAVLIIPLDNRVTPQMVANKFIKYGKILQVRPIKGSSTCIVIFSKSAEANNCIRLFENHDKVRVTRPEQLCVSIIYHITPISSLHIHI